MALLSISDSLFTATNATRRGVVAQSIHGFVTSSGTFVEAANRLVNGETDHEVVELPSRLTGHDRPDALVLRESTGPGCRNGPGTVLDHGECQCLEAAMERITEVELVSVTFGLDPECRLDHVLDGRAGIRPTQSSPISLGSVFQILRL